MDVFLILREIRISNKLNNMNKHKKKDKSHSVYKTLKMITQSLGI